MLVTLGIPTEISEPPMPKIATANKNWMKLWAKDLLIIDKLKIIQAINKLKPSSAKGVYIRSVTISSTMGVGVSIDTNNLIQQWQERKRISL